jgi:SAM-dependent methyltransferase
MHESVRRWISDQSARLGPCRVLEVGSYDENGSIRNCFGPDYIGVDMREGPGVDLAVNGNDLALFFDEAMFDVVVSTETLEHDRAFWVTLKQMGHVLRAGGLLLLTMRGNGFPHHAYPHDYWRFMPDCADALLDLADCDRVEVQVDPEMPGLFIAGHRR